MLRQEPGGNLPLGVDWTWWLLLGALERVDPGALAEFPVCCAEGRVRSSNECVKTS